MRKQYGLIGEHLGHSYSKRLHGLLGSYAYELYALPPEELERFLGREELAGLNVTIPYKRQVIPFCAEISSAAQRIGSVNTLLRRADGGWYGENTDAFGFAYLAKRAGMDFAGQKILVLGSGGTSRTVCAVVEEAGGTPVVVSRAGENHYQNLHRHRDANLLVNTTPVGMYPHTAAAPVDLAALPCLKGVLDVVYNPLRTRLLQQAEALGLACSNGLPMLLAQAARASELFTGAAIPPEKLEGALRSLRRQMNLIVLVGMPGAGKTTVGQEVAKRLGLPLVDLDSEIEKESGQSIPALFEREGEEAFRDREAALLERFAKEGSQVLVTGGGAVLRPENRENMRLNGFVVHVTRPMEGLCMEGRPLSKSREALENLWRERAPFYQAVADVAIANESNPEQCAGRILEAYDEAVCH